MSEKSFKKTRLLYIYQNLVYCKPDMTSPVSSYGLTVHQVQPNAMKTIWGVIWKQIHAGKIFNKYM